MAATRKRVTKVFPKENPDKPWTEKKKYKKWVGILTRKKTPRRTKEEDLCVGEESICKGDLGIPRKYMPQFSTLGELKRFRKFINKAYSIKSFKSTRKARDLRPSQSEISRKRINDLVREPDSIFTKVMIPLVVSKDNYIVDGHHRWAAYRTKRPEKPLPVIVMEAPIKDVLGIAVAWGAKHEEF
jgi:ParB-like nuclease domain